MSNINVLTFISLIRGNMPWPDAAEGDSSIGIITEVFTQGNCGNFAQALKIAFGGEVVFSDTHLLCRLDGRMYDITGDVTRNHPNWRPATMMELEDMTNNYSFSDRGSIL